ncbi:FkbM family methyltransferase [Burkholderia multivorans]|uniref:FkbM family methyltransferase n=1 Tax=Burkholderia multivorans TaxID=87883 RepID=A0AAP2HN69_9BURK|nr:FkbM family methyltransferase [Burkholderia multivorans]MBU9359544.1 FkbM family methyltransferase [Burkholderia multivorans]
MNELAIRLAQVRDLRDQGLIKLDFENMLQTHYRRWIQPGDTVVDIGAHKGRHLQHFMNCVGSRGRVIAFEPLPIQHSLLRKKYRGNSVSIHRIALSDEIGQTEFTYARGTPEESGLKPRIYNFPRRANPTKIKVNVDRLDNFTSNLSTLSFVKIDTEGGEIGCLRGATETLTRLRPIVSVEYGYPSYSGYGYTRDTLFDLASEKGYVLYDVFLNSLAERADWHIACDSIYWDFFMIPAERQEEFISKIRGISSSR